MNKCEVCAIFKAKQKHVNKSDDITKIAIKPN